jgi:NAD(P)-dependent dehydrogenase (short-subunit alcohol dehydrogenase family)
MALNLSLDGQSAIVTGGASGIGRATALLLAQAGARVTVFDIDDDLASTLKDKSVRVQHCDMSISSEIDKTFSEFLAHEKKIDILVNNVGIWVPGGDILAMSDDIIAKMEAVNVAGPRHLTRLVMNDMKSRKAGGSVVFVSSTQAHLVDGSPTIYNVEKNTILGMTKAFAVAGGPLGIRVNSISPGAIATDGMGVAHAVGKERILAGNHKTPLGRRGNPEEVAFEIVSLCFATYTNGDNRIVDGGFSKVALPADLAVQRKETANDPDAVFLSET